MPCVDGVYHTMMSSHCTIGSTIGHQGSTGHAPLPASTGAPQGENKKIAEQWQSPSGVPAHAEKLALKSGMH